MSKGRRKPRLRDYSYIRISSEARRALKNVVASFEVHPIVTAIIGQALVEIELDELLRQMFKRNDDSTWEKLLEDRGPLATFNAKIIMGYAFGIFDAKITEDLHRMRRIRNAFAHSKKLIHFNDELVIAEMLPAHSLTKIQSEALSARSLSADSARSIYTSLCFAISVKLIMRQNKRLTAKGRRLRAKYNKMRASLQSQQSLLQLLQGHQTDDPNSQSQLGLLSAMLHDAPEPADKKDT